MFCSVWVLVFDSFFCAGLSLLPRLFSLVLVDGEGGGELPFLVMCRLLFAMASPVQGIQALVSGRLRSWYTGLVAPQHVRIFLRPGVEPVSSALAGGLLTTGLLEKS